MRVAVIGGGPIGLATAKCFGERGFRPTLFEQEADIGGVWLYRDHADGLYALSTLNSSPDRNFTVHSSCYQSLVTNSSSLLTQFSDFPFVREEEEEEEQTKERSRRRGVSRPFFPTHEQIMRYLRAYVQAFNLQPMLRLDTRVLEVRRNSERKSGGKEEGEWMVSTRHGQSQAVQTERFDAVMVCSGMFWDPNVPSFVGQDKFKGVMLHSHYYRKEEAYRGKRVLLVGIGNSALDISTELVGVAKSVLLSARSGHLILNVADDNGDPLDCQFLTRETQHLPASEAALRFAQWTGHCTQTFIRHGMPMPHPNVQKNSYSILKRHNEYLQFLEDGKVRIFPDINSITSPHTVRFIDGREEDVDVIILCTGYRMGFPFLSSSASSSDLTPGLEEGRLDVYKRVMHPLYPSLCFIGQLDTIGSAFVVGEMQARWAAHLLKAYFDPSSSSSAFPSEAQRRKDAEQRKAKLRSTRPKYPLFISYWTYMDDLARDIGCCPSPSLSSSNEEAKRSVMEQLKKGPICAAQYRLQGPCPWNDAERMLAKL
ncbi:Cyclopentanone 1,2-monooxygenase (CPMO) [Balamuthia mandrillaris]